MDAHYHRRSSRKGRRLPAPVRAAALLFVALCAFASSAEGHARPRLTHAEPMLVIHGAGDGHGVGMSQWGALGFAEHGWSAAAILGHYYTGTSIGNISKKRIVKVLIGTHVKKIPIEAYVRGVIAAEMPASWPTAALQAQAIASRTYAITDKAGGKRFDVYSDTRSQLYLGKRAETPRSNAAVKATAGEIVTYEGKPAITFFFASSGGETEDVENSFPGAEAKPWLVGVSDPFERGPLHAWTKKMSFVEAMRRLSGLCTGVLQGIEVVKRGFSPRIVTAQVICSRSKTEVSGGELAYRLGLYDTWDYFSILQHGKLHPEPDVSGWHAPPAEGAPTPPGGSSPPAAPPPPPSEPSGGTPSS